jgi:hypothetical protein
MNKHIVQLIRERFYPLVRFCGPQSAGEVEIEGVRATVYLGELSIWLWPAKSSHNGVLSDEQLGDVVSPHLLVRNLLLSAQTSIQCLSCHLDRIEAESASSTLESPLDSSKHIIAQLLCPVQRSLGLSGWENGFNVMCASRFQ